MFSPQPHHLAQRVSGSCYEMRLESFFLLREHFLLFLELIQILLQLTHLLLSLCGRTSQIQDLSSQRIFLSLRFLVASLRCVQPVLQCSIAAWDTTVNILLVLTRGCIYGKLQDQARLTPFLAFLRSLAGRSDS